MPIQPTYPGVYVEEIPSGVRSIAGVATSVTAFVGRAPRGPIDKPVTINNFGDYERRFGGLHTDSMMSYAVRDFYQNGGSRAVIVRVAKDATPVTISLLTVADATGKPLILKAISPGNWGKAVSASVNHTTREEKDNHPRKTDFFNLTIQEKGGAIETFLNVSINKVDVRYVARVLAETSALMIVEEKDVPTIRPIETLPVTITLPTATAGKELVLAPANQVSQGSRLSVSVKHGATAKLFTLTVLLNSIVKETFTDVSIDAGADFAGDKLKTSKLIQVRSPDPITERPNETPNPVSTAPYPVLDMALPDPPIITLPCTTGTKVPLVLEASDEVVRLGTIPSASVNYTGIAAGDTKLFNLIITVEGEAPKKFDKVSIDPAAGADFVETKLKTSALVRVRGSVPADRPDETLNPVGPMSADGSVPDSSEYIGSKATKTGIQALLGTDFNLLCIPPAEREGDKSQTHPTIYSDALQLCVKKRAVLLVDPPHDWGTSGDKAVSDAEKQLLDLRLTGSDAKNAALYFPRIKQADPLFDGQTQTFVPCGMVAGIMARTDSSRGVWKSPAGLDASLNGIQGLQVNLTDDENGQLNPLGINCLRQFPVTGRVVWGARTLRGADQLADTDNKYVAVRRTSLFIEESLFRGTQWVVFEPNDEPLWAQIRLNVGAFMHNLFRQGAFQGKTPKEAYLVRCDSETTNQTDINQGVVNIVVGFAPLKPAEFVFIKLQQLSGKIDV